jgi:hypothetical protein
MAKGNQEKKPVNVKRNSNDYSRGCNNTKRLSLVKFFVRLSKWANGIWLAIQGKQIMPTERQDWSIDYGYGETP